MCSTPEKDAKKSSKCCPNLKVSKIIRKVCVGKRKVKDSNKAAMVIPIASNNENLPPDFNSKTKKYTVNKKRNAQQHYERLRKHVPTLEGKEDVSQLDVLLEAIQYIQALKKDLNKPDSDSDTNPEVEQVLQQPVPKQTAV